MHLTLCRTSCLHSAKTTRSSWQSSKVHYPSFLLCNPPFDAVRGHVEADAPAWARGVRRHAHLAGFRHDG